MKRNTIYRLLTTVMLLWIGSSSLFAQATVENVSIIEGTSNAVVTVTLPGAAPVGGTTVLYAITANTAVEGSDYTVPGDRIVIPQGSSTGTISIPIIGDATEEDLEDFSISVSTDLANDAGFNNATTFWTSTGTIGFETGPETTYGGPNGANIVLEVDLGSQGYQDIATISGVTYDVVFKASRRTSGGPASANVTVAALNGATTLNSLTVTKTTAGNPTFSLDEETFSFTAASATTRIAFTTTNTNTVGIIFDDLSIVPQTADDSATVTIVDKTPGDVGANLSLWLKADVDATPAQWDDQSGNGLDATGSNNPVLTADALNFNPAFTFNGTNQNFTGPAGNTALNSDDVTSFTVYINDDVSGGFTSPFTNRFSNTAGVPDAEGITFYNNGSGREFWTGSGSGSTWNVQSAGNVTEGVAEILGLTTTGGVGAVQNIYVNGTSAGTGTGTGTHIKQTDGFYPYRVGSGDNFGGTNFFFDGRIAEQIVYGSVLDATSRQKIESYLAIKYGMTLNAGNTAYLASDGTTQVWAVDPTYANDIFGIARDDASGLNQEISKSVNDGAVLTVATNTDFTTANDGSRTDLFNQQFLLIANDGGSTTKTTAVGVPAALEARLERQWKVKNTGLVNNGGTGVINLSFDIDASPLREYRLIRNGTALTGIVPTINGSKVEFTNVGLTDGAVFSLGFTQIAPGDVVPGLSLWLKADDNGGVTVDNTTLATWEDQSGAGFDVTATGGAQPTFQNDASNLVNFNSAVLFDGTDDVMERAANVLPNTADPTVAGNHSLFAVMIVDTGSNIVFNQESTDGGGDRVVPAFASNGNYAHSDNSAGSFTNIVGAGSSATIPLIQSVTRNGVAVQLYQNGTVGNTANLLPPISTPSGRTTIGGRDQATQGRFGGRMLEMIAYASDVTADRNRIESYLAIKYGITLDASIVDYVDAAGSSVYNLATYPNDVFGIANDAAQGLDQQISKSVNTGSVLTLSSTNDFATANDGSRTVLTDGQFLLIGNDGASGAVADAISTDLDATTYFTRTAREWKSVNTGTIAGAMNLQFDGYDDTWVLLTRTADGDFSATTGTTETALSATGTVSIALPGTTFFTLAKTVTSIEFEAAAANDLEADGGNLPRLLIDGTLNEDTNIDVVLNAAGTATAGTDYTFADASGDAAVTIPVDIPAGTYTSGTPIALSSLRQRFNQQNYSYPTVINPSAQQEEMFVAPFTGDYEITFSAETFTNNGLVRVGTTSGVQDGVGDIFDGAGDRIDAVTPLKKYTFSLTQGTTYYIYSVAGGTSTMTNVNVVLDYVPPINFAITDESLVESDETIDLTLSNAQPGLVIQEITGGALIDNHVYTITNDDSATVTIAADADADEATASRAFTLTMSAAASTDVDVSYALTGTAADPADYDDATTVVGTVTIAAGTTTGTIDLTVVNDTEVEVIETVIATLTAATNNASVTADTTAETLNITDDDAAALTISIAQTTDGAESGTPTNAQFTVSLDGGVTNNTGSAITGTLALTGTATAGSDYTNVTTFSIADGDSSVVVDIPVLDDTEVEVTETVIATISAPSVGAVSATDNATANITDDDLAALTISIAQTTDGAESGTPTNAQFTVSLDGGVTNNTGAAITGTIALTGTATSGSDYTNVTTFSIADGDSSVVVDIPVLDDTEVEVTETVIATISAPSVGAVSATDNATADITDDDATALTISIAQTTDGAESGTPTNAQFTVSLDGGVTNNTGSAITGTITLTGTATAGSDYTNVTTFSIADGDSSVVVDIPVLDDTEVEVTETVIATISAPSVGAVSATDNATANITDDDAAALTISIAQTTDGAESGTPTNAQFTVSLDGGVTNNTGAAITGTITLTGTATAGSDYTNVTTFSIADGDSSVVVDIPVLDDTEVEVTETVIATISAPSVGAVSATDNATANITDDDLAALTISIGTPVDGTEGTSNITYTVSLDGGVTNNTGSAITGTVALTGTATNGTDYTNVTTFSIADGASSGTITVTVTDDTDVEVNETVIATISAPSIGAIGTAAATANIIDDDGAALTISIGSPVDGTEGGANVSYTVSLDGGATNTTGSAITGTVTLTGTATNGTDYTNVTTFSIANTASSGTITVPVTDDSDVEVSETVIATISAPNVGAINTAAATANILDNDTAGLTISIGSPVDGTEGTSNVSYTVSLDGGLSNGTGAAITGTVALTGTATNGSDYTNVTTFSIADGASSGTITVTVTNDTDVEINETVIATISAPSVGAIGTAAATANIIDDDSAALTISIGSPVDGTEGGANVSYTVSLDGGTTNTTGAAITGTVTLTGTATNGTDYTDVTTFSIADGASSGTITVTVTDDSDVEVSETVIATISAPSVGAVSATDNATANILDNDTAGLTISIGSPVDGTEGTSNVSYTVSMDGGLSNGTGAAITGTVALTGTATNGTDYTNVTTFSIADGASSGTITVLVTDDTDVEINETVIATISAPSVGAIGTAAATANIIDDDSGSLTVSIGSPVDGTEGGANISYTVSLDGGVTNTTGSPITGTITLTGTATSGSDYTNVTSFSIANNSSAVVVPVTVTDDTEVEVSETVIATISLLNIGSVGTAAATANIADNDAGALTLSIGSPVDGTEGGTNVSYTVSMDGGLSNGTGAAITGTVTLTGTATNGTDYTNVTTFSIADGASTGTIIVPVTDDTDVEVSETVIATISAPSVGAIGTAAATANIADNDAAALMISIGSPVDGTEGGANVSYTVSLDGGLSNGTGAAITGTVALTGTATAGSDYTNVTTFSIANGASSGTVTVTVTDDSVVEVSETVIATISAPSVGMINTAAATANIGDNDTAGLTISIGSPVDGTEGTSNVTYTVSLDGGLSNGTGVAITGTVALTGTATAGSDYTNVTTFSIADGASSGTITVPVTDDTNVEVSETVIATISAPSVGMINTAAATANIIDNDLAALTISIAATTDGIEGTPATDAIFTVSLDGGVTNTTGVAITGTVALTGGTAINGTDFTDVTSFSIADGTGSVAITVPILDDTDLEGTETIIATISAPSVGMINGTNGSATANLIDDDVDSDGDGVADSVDNCPNTSTGLAVDANGCPTVASIVSVSDDPADGGFTGDDLTGTGVTNVNNDNIDKYEKLIAQASPAPVTVADLQVIIDLANAIADIVANSDDPADGNPSAADLIAVGLNNVQTDNVGLYEEVIANTNPEPCTLAELQAIIDEVNEIVVIVNNADDPADGNPSIDDLNDVGVTDLDPDLQDAYEIAIANANPKPRTLAELQAIIDAVNANPPASTLTVEQGFSPNGDGVNDTWIIGGIESFPNHEIKLFNRWGNEVFSAINYQNDWNGVSNGKRVLGGSGDRLPTGAYYYVIETGTSEVAPFTGWIYINY